MSHQSAAHIGAVTGNPKTFRHMFGGMALVAAGFGAFYLNLERRQANKELNDKLNPGYLPTWQYRLHQASSISNEPVEGTYTLKASRIENRATPIPKRTNDHPKSHPVVRDRGDGLSYTKRADWTAGYSKHMRVTKVNDDGGKELEIGSVVDSAKSRLDTL